MRYEVHRGRKVHVPEDEKVLSHILWRVSYSLLWQSHLAVISRNLLAEKGDNPTRQTFCCIAATRETITLVYKNINSLLCYYESQKRERERRINSEPLRFTPRLDTYPESLASSCRVALQPGATWPLFRATLLTALPTDCWDWKHPALYIFWTPTHLSSDAPPSQITWYFCCPLFTLK